MARFLSFFAKNKILDDKLYKKEEKINQDHRYVMYHHAEVTSRLVNDLVHIHIKTPNLNKEDLGPDNNAKNFSDGGNVIAKLRACENGQRQLQKSENISNFGKTHQPIKSLHLPRVEIHNSKVYYQYKCTQWKKLSPSKRTRILLYKADSVQRILQRVNGDDSHFINTQPEQTTTTATQCTSKLIDNGPEERCIINGDDDRKTLELSVQVDRLPSIDGIAIRNFCSWRRDFSTGTPVWCSKKSRPSATREYHLGRSLTNL